MPSLNPAARKVILVILTLLVCLTAWWLRFYDLGAQPFHADEAATGAQTLAYRLEASGYEFDPKHHHGPLLTAIAEPWSRLQGEKSWQDLQAITMRQVTAAAGLLTVLGALILGMGGRRAVIAMALVATSPLLVYYSRLFIHEPIFLLFAMPTVAGFVCVLEGRHAWLAAFMLGLGIGGMTATRETVAVSILAWTLAGLLLAWREFKGQGVPEIAVDTLKRSWQPLVFAVSLAVGIAYLFYTSGGRNSSGFIDFLSTYFQYETGEGHDKPFGYYFKTLVWPKSLAGFWWTEAGILALALCVYLQRRGTQAFLTGRFFFEAGLFHLLIFSVLSYKTPWLACLGWLHLCLAGGYGGAALIRQFKGVLRSIPVAAIVLIVFWQGLQAKRASFRLASDARNPYAYVPTSKDITTLAPWLGEVRAALPQTKEEPIAVIGEQYWPLPWYLRSSGVVGYWTEPPENATDFAVLLILPSSLEAIGPSLEATHTLIPRGLRNEVPVFAAIRNDLWSAYLAK